MEQPTRPRHQDLQPPHSLRPQFSSAQFSSRSAEADDERSYASSNTSSMSPPSIDGEEESSPPPSYEGEDTRPTSRKELAGFYAYSFAAEVFVICGLGAFIPITLEDLARGSPSAVLASDPTKSCKTRVDIPEVAAFSAYSSDGRKHVNNQCVFNLLGLEINTASFAMYTFSISVLLQALVVVTMSGAADHGKFRKTMLLTFAVVGAVATMLYLPITPNTYLLGSLWAIVGNVCFGASFVLLNSFLPLLVRHHPNVLARREGSTARSRNEVGHIVFDCLLGPVAFYILFAERASLRFLAIPGTLSFCCHADSEPQVYTNHGC